MLKIHRCMKIKMLKFRNDFNPLMCPKVAVFSGKWWQKRLVSIHHRVIDVRSLDSSQRNMPMTHPSNSRPQWGEILYEIESYILFKKSVISRDI